MITPSINPQTRRHVRCWNCKHLKKRFRGVPKDGELFSEELLTCTIRNTDLEYWQVTTQRECSHYLTSRPNDIPQDAQTIAWESPANPS
ncbi:hypothetical protein KAH85_01610 [Candidatus Bathyarchaeota archaeon]|nr:hypothetical protein [Candidatus Bathyarchaeota archaeon]